MTSQTPSTPAAPGEADARVAAELAAFGEAPPAPSSPPADPEHDPNVAWVAALVEVRERCEEPLARPDLSDLARRRVWRVVEARVRQHAASSATVTSRPARGPWLAVAAALLLAVGMAGWMHAKPRRAGGQDSQALAALADLAREEVASLAADAPGGSRAEQVLARYERGGQR